MPVRTRSRVRIYHQVRSAHLERAAQLPQATLLFAHKRYDFAEELAADLDLVQARSWRAAWWLLRNPVETLEINEPLMLVAARSTAIALLGVWARLLLGGPRTRIVSYAIENLDPATSPAQGRRRLRRQLDLLLSRFIWRSTDRIAYGTASAQRLYAKSFPGKHAPEQTLIWALPAPATPRHGVKRPGQALFLGAFSERKGLPQLLDAWPRVIDTLRDAKLELVGKGALEPLVAQQVSTSPGMALKVDPPRTEIRQCLDAAQVLVLPSQPTKTWREQVGLPIVEGLSYGCTIVTTTETGLADWLQDHGHQVIDASAGPTELADAMCRALAAPLDPEQVISELPADDGRLAADRWLFR